MALLAAGLVARGCGSAGRNITKDEAIEIAREAVPVDREKVQVRFLQRGIPPQPVWAVSLYNVDKNGYPVNALVVVVSAATGEIIPR